MFTAVSANIERQAYLSSGAINEVFKTKFSGDSKPMVTKTAEQESFGVAQLAGIYGGRSGSPGFARRNVATSRAAGSVRPLRHSQDHFATRNGELGTAMELVLERLRYRLFANCFHGSVELTSMRLSTKSKVAELRQRWPAISSKKCRSSGTWPEARQGRLASLPPVIGQARWTCITPTATVATTSSLDWVTLAGGSAWSELHRGSM